MNFPKRNILPNETPIDFPDELGYICPNNLNHRNLHWSEYEAHIWCYDCEKDYPSCFCKGNLEDNMKIFYSTFELLSSKKSI